MLHAGPRGHIGKINGRQRVVEEHLVPELLRVVNRDMNAGVSALDQIPNQLPIRNPASDDFNVRNFRQRGHFIRIAGEDGHPVALRGHLQRHVRSDESGSAGEEEVHAFTLLWKARPN